ncbi:MAG: RNA 2',3'-cyclic phosphodiesterase [Desulfobacterales bacterium]|nr:MAG: RNA 2',3'-cyclic phosphodiesterase [Desulfobacterales bacterium]
MARTIRSFIAIKLPDSIIAAIREIQEDIRANGFKLRWVRPENIHLTLKFLGDITEGGIENVTTAIYNSVKPYAPLSLCAKGIGVFPGIKRPRVVWIGVAGQIESLIGLQGRLEEALELLGFEKEKRPFKGHLTLGRIKHRIDPKRFGDILKKHVGFTSETFYADEVILYKSELKPTGAVYTEIVNVPLGG